MAKTHVAFQAQAENLQDALIKFRDWWHSEARPIQQVHAAQYTDAGDPTKPAYIQEDADTNIDGTTFDRNEYMNGVTILEQIENLMTNLTVTEADYKTTMSEIIG